jgi:hypothetical protein
MVLAQGLGDEDRQAPRDEKGNRCKRVMSAFDPKATIGERRKNGDRSGLPPLVASVPNRPCR